MPQRPWACREGQGWGEEPPAPPGAPKGGGQPRTHCTGSGIQGPDTHRAEGQAAPSVGWFLRGLSGSAPRGVRVTPGLLLSCWCTFGNYQRPG